MLDLNGNIRSIQSRYRPGFECLKRPSVREDFVDLNESLSRLAFINHFVRMQYSWQRERASSSNSDRSQHAQSQGQELCPACALLLGRLLRFSFIFQIGS